MTNPFIFDRPLSVDQAVDRTAELEQLLQLALGGQSARLAAPRRFGKTTLLRALAHHAWESHGLIPAFVDLSRVTSVEDVVLRIAGSYRQRLSPGVWRTIRARLSAQLQARLPGVGSATIALAARSPDAGGLGTLHEALDLPLAVHERTGQRCLVIFDEFQDLLTLDQELDGVLRSHIQHHLEAASYLFAGSQPSLMAALFGDRRGPLFDQARAVPLGRLPLAPLGDFVADTLERRGRDDLVEHVDALVALSTGHPQRAMLLAYELFAQPRDAEDPFGDAVSAAVVEAADGLEQTWRGLTAAQRRVLGAVADGHRQLLAGPALTRTGLGKSSQAAVRDALVEATHLGIEGTTVCFVDPLMPVWIIAGPQT